MSARDDYPTLRLTAAGKIHHDGGLYRRDGEEMLAALDEIDGLRADLQLAQGRLNRSRKREADYAELVRELAADSDAERAVRKQFAAVLVYWRKGHRAGCACAACDALRASAALDEAQR